jgi:hypothetical protein
MTFDSTRQAANALNLPYNRVLTAKQLGCPAFRNGRVYPGLIAWLTEKNNRSDVNYHWCNGEDKLTPHMLRRAQKILDKIDAKLSEPKAAE